MVRLPAHLGRRLLPARVRRRRAPLAILGAATIIVVIGVVDDLYDLDWMTKLAGQIIAAGVLAWQGVQLVSLPIGSSLAIGSPFMSLILTILAVVLVMNAVNFIDGLDGLVAGVTIIANGVFFVYSFVISLTIGQTEYFNLAALLTAVLIGACLGFLPLNWHPARLFMGDAGALLTGLLMATSAISVTGQIDPATISRHGAPAGLHPDPAAVRDSDRAPPRLRARGRPPGRAPASRPSRPTASTSTTACSTWGTRTSRPC